MSTEAARPNFPATDDLHRLQTKRRALQLAFGTATGFAVANALSWPASLLTPHHVHPTFGRIARVPDAGIGCCGDRRCCGVRRHWMAGDDGCRDTEFVRAADRDALIHCFLRA